MKYRKSMNHNYLVVEYPGDKETDYQLEMLTENRIQGLLPLERRLNEGREELYYEISSLQPLGRLYDHKEMKQKDAAVILRGILEICASLQDYMLSEDALVLDAELLFVEPDSLKPCLMLKPWEEKSFRQQMRELTEYLMEHVEQNDEANAMWMYKLYKLVKNDNFVLSDIEALLDKRDEGETEGRKCIPPEYEERERNSMSAREEQQPWEKRKDSGRKNVQTGKAPKGRSSGEYESGSEQEKEIYKDWEDIPLEEDITDGKKKAPLALIFSTLMLAVGVVLISGILPVQDPAFRLLGIGFFAGGAILLILQLILQKKEEPEKRDGENAREEEGNVLRMQNQKGEDPLGDDRDSAWDNKRRQKHTGFSRGSGKKREKTDSAGRRKNTDPAGNMKEVSGGSHKEWDFSADFAGMERRPDPEAEAEEEPEEDMEEISGSDLTETDGEECEEYGKTVFMGAENRTAENILVEKDHGKCYPIESFPFTIGKVKNCVDLALNDRSVSRIHARILMQNGRAYLQDCHSTNGTYLNGIQLEAEEEVMLEKDDEIMIGKVCFCYQ